MSKHNGYQIHLELIHGSDGQWGYSFAMSDCGGSAKGGLDPETALLKAYQAVRKELKRLAETKEAKAARLDKAKRVAALTKAKEEGLLNG